MNTDLIAKIIGTGFFIFIVLLLLFKLYSAIRKVKGLMPLIDVWLVKLWGKDILGRLNKDGISKEESTENKDKGGLGEGIERDKSKDFTDRNSSSNSSSRTAEGTTRGNSNNNKGTVDRDAVIQSSSSKQRDIEPVRKYKSIFKESD